jgi:putative chitinase
MICFLNRYLKPIDGVKYKFKYDGKELSGKTTTTSYCFEITTRTVTPITVWVWSIKSNSYKQLDDVIPLIGKPQLVRKILSTVKVKSTTEAAEKTSSPAARPRLPPPPTPAGPSPADKQGVDVNSRKNESGVPQTQIERAVPGEVTLSQLRNIFPIARLATDDYLKAIAAEVNVDLVRFKLDTPLRRAHFFSQIKGETGESMKPQREGWQYSKATLMAFSQYYRDHPAEAESDAYLKDHRGKIIRRANEDAIGTKHFGKLNGNRATHPEDGSKFRGRGLLQITGFKKYDGFTQEYGRDWTDAAPDCVEDPELIVKFPYSIRSAIWFWRKFNVYELADGGSQPTNVTKVSLRINGGSMGLKERKDAFVIAYGAFR